MDELLLPVQAVAIGLWVFWYVSFLANSSLRSSKTLSWWFWILPPLFVAALMPALLFAASPDVRQDGGAIFVYLGIGAIWLRLGWFLLEFSGLSVRDDVVERRNGAVARTALGATAGLLFCFVGSNIGRGPGPEAVLFCASLSTAGFFVLWFCLTWILGLADRLTVERDESLGTRMGGLCASVGLILGGAVAGDWKSFDATLRDFARFTWPVLALLIIAIVTETRWRSCEKGSDTTGVQSIGIAAGYVVLAGAYLLWPHRR